MAELGILEELGSAGKAGEAGTFGDIDETVGAGMAGQMNPFLECPSEMEWMRWLSSK